MAGMDPTTPGPNTSWRWWLASRSPHLCSYRRQADVTEGFAMTWLRTAMLHHPYVAPYRILIVGSGDGGLGIEAVEALARTLRARVVEFDLYPRPGRQLIADAAEIPFAAGAFDAVIAQGVLEHVLDPQQVVAEMYRVLQPNGLIFITTPFLWGVHMGARDFTRWSRLGLMRLLRAFRPMEIGVIEGVSVAAAYAIAYFLMAIAPTWAVKPVKYTMNYLLWPFKLIDPWLRHRPASIDAALSYFYVGQKMLGGWSVSDVYVLGHFEGAGVCPW